MDIHASYMAPTILGPHVPWQAVEEGKERWQKDALAFKLPQARSDPHQFCSLSLEESKPYGLLRCKETEVRSSRAPRKLMWVGGGKQSLQP